MGVKVVMDNGTWIDLEEIKQQVEKEKLEKVEPKTELSTQVETETTTQPKSNLAIRNETLDNAINEDYAKSMGELQKTTDYQETIKNVVEQGAKTKLEADMLAILSEKQKNELAQYTLEIQKDQLDYRKKKEKKLIKEEVNAEIAEKKIEIQKKKYGYLYKTDKDGNLIDFVPNTFVNKFRAVCHWYANLGGGIKKVLWTTIKIGLIVGGVFLAIKGMSWLANSGILDNLKK